MRRRGFGAPSTYPTWDGSCGPCYPLQVAGPFGCISHKAGACGQRPCPGHSGPEQQPRLPGTAGDPCPPPGHLRLREGWTGQGLCGCCPRSGAAASAASAATAVGAPVLGWSERGQGPWWVAVAKGKSPQGEERERAHPTLRFDPEAGGRAGSRSSCAGRGAERGSQPSSRSRPSGAVRADQSSTWRAASAHSRLETLQLTVRRAQRVRGAGRGGAACSALGGTRRHVSDYRGPQLTRPCLAR